MARELDDHCRKRRALWAAYRKAGPRKRQRLLKFNLGKKRWESRRERARREVENLINRALNHLLASRPSDVYLVEQFAESFDYSGMSREVRRRLSGWMRGVIADRLAFKVAERGARLVYVPPTIRVKNALSAPLSGVISEAVIAFTVSIADTRPRRTATPL